MGRAWKDVKADKERYDTATGRDIAATRETARNLTDAYVLGHRLAELRADLGLTQTQVAERMGISQPRVSQLEHGDIAQMEVDTLQRYVAALGGHLKIVVNVDDRDVTVSTSQSDISPLSA